MAVMNTGGMEGDPYLIEDLRAALDMARRGDATGEAEMTERIRDLSYDMELRQAGYLVRSACGAIDAVLRGSDRGAGLAFAEHEIDKVQDMLLRASAA
ncbi:hypothetical protein [Celeribacter persicus]|jgi:hypothetical protein|uniref:Hpt domain-containing protein n=1 Tax=Celeribacter persicus TaxID=1651082 RepID=A0A2T5HBD9_9RHOB|nr:hypothetical protein [Celeribacter persicus]PTQ68889.1 hypothetical protein C8N42_11331 [Celeribacter persicus]